MYCDLRKALTASVFQSQLWPSLLHTMMPLITTNGEFTFVEWYMQVSSDPKSTVSKLFLCLFFHRRQLSRCQQPEDCSAGEDWIRKELHRQHHPGTTQVWGKALSVICDSSVPKRNKAYWWKNRECYWHPRDLWYIDDRVRAEKWNREWYPTVSPRTTYLPASDETGCTVHKGREEYCELDQGTLWWGSQQVYNGAFH